MVISLFLYIAISFSFFLIEVSCMGKVKWTVGFGMKNTRSFCPSLSFSYICALINNAHFIGIIDTQCAETFFFNERSNLVESYFLFEILWIYHAL